MEHGEKSQECRGEFIPTVIRRPLSVREKEKIGTNKKESLIGIRPIFCSEGDPPSSIPHGPGGKRLRKRGKKKTQTHLAITH